MTHPSRYTGALEFLTAGLGVLVSITMLDPDGSIRFIDGKHRFCVYRDLGLSCIPLLVPASQKGVGLAWTWAFFSSFFLVDVFVLRTKRLG